jgi:hypothetical protein
VVASWGILVALVFSSLFMTAEIVRAQTIQRTIVPGNVEIDAATEMGLTQALHDPDNGLPLELRSFAVTDVTSLGNVRLISLVGMLDIREDWTLDRDAAWMGLAIVKEEGGQIVGAIEGTVAFSEILSRLPQTAISNRAKAALDPRRTPAGPLASTSSEIPRFPWETGYTMQYGKFGVHANGFSSIVSNWKAVDFLSDGNTALGRAPNKLLASLSGTISYVCRDNVSVAVRIGSFFYSHLLDNANLKVGQEFAQGDSLGQLRSGDFNDRCGYAEQPDGWFHVHWGFPNVQTLEVAGWTLDVSEQVWKNGSQTRGINTWIYATTTSCTGPTPSANQVILYTGFHYCGDYTILGIGSYANAASMGITDNAVSSVRVGDHVMLTAYEAQNFSGISEHIVTSDPDLRDNSIGNDTISSLEVVALVDTPPVVVSVQRADPNPTDASTVTFTVTFSEPVTGVDTAAPFEDFILTTSIPDAAIMAVSGSEATYNVVVDTGAGDGTIRLDVIDDDSIQDASGAPLGDWGVGNGDFTTGEVYSILRKPIFKDVGRTYWAWEFIERLYGVGVTGGCSVDPLQYCPEMIVTRDQMAVFLLRGIYGSTYNPPPMDEDTGFSDVPTDYWAGAWIKQLATEGITGGCGTDLYCPGAPVTRDQMAVFLLRSKYGKSYTPPALDGNTGFTDVPDDHWAAAWIKQLVVEGITAGCGADTYCPGDPVTRAQMAVFLVRAFGIP